MMKLTAMSLCSVLMMAACATEDVSSSTSESALTKSDGDSINTLVPSDTPVPIDATKTTLVDNRICWSVAGLYFEDSCSVREDMPSGTPIDFIDRNNYLRSCDGGANIWWHVANHATGHHGYVRADALCH